MQAFRRLWNWLLLGWSRQAYIELLMDAIALGDKEAEKIALKRLEELDKK